MKSLGNPTRNFMFTGKGGVGKTSIACATAVFLAEGGKRVLLVSTDPASNLDEVLETELAMHPTPVDKVKGLFAMNVDPEEAARHYRERVVGPFANSFRNRQWKASKSSFRVRARRNRCL